jgi:molybdate-binding protein/DNA-binding transcriptional regulator YhcF (GntR family)
MEDRPTYQKIADFLKDEILSGTAQPGSKLPGVRELSDRWGCTPGTVQKAFDILVRAGLVDSKPGRGTYVSGGATNFIPHYESLRRTSLVLKIEQFILENNAAGYSLAEISEALNLAVAHWQMLEDLPQEQEPTTIRFCGSSDTIINLLADVMDRYIPGRHMTVDVVGSMEGLIALAQNKADLAGCHLWDPETNSYNLPYIYKVLSGRPVKVVTLAHRRIGLITSPGNPLNIQSLADLARPDVRFVNRQKGSPVRLWLDQQLTEQGLQPEYISGYEVEKRSHTEMARMIAEGKVDAGIGLEAAAKSFGLDYVHLTSERYDLVALLPYADLSPVADLFNWLKTDSSREFIQVLYGYETTQTGEEQNNLKPG